MSQFFRLETEQTAKQTDPVSKASTIFQTKNKCLSSFKMIASFLPPLFIILQSNCQIDEFRNFEMTAHLGFRRECRFSKWILPISFYFISIFIFSSAVHFRWIIQLARGPLTPHFDRHHQLFPVALNSSIFASVPSQFAISLKLYSNIWTFGSL